MSIREINCKILVCDGCGRHFDADDFTPHYDTAEQAREESVNDDWRSDGKHDWCEPCRSEPHDCAPDPAEPEVCVRCDAEIEVSTR